MNMEFKEEKKTLAKVERKLKALEKRYRQEADQCSNKMTGYHCVDYEDQALFSGMNGKYRRAEALAQEYKSYQDSPYFARMDLDCMDENGETGVYYIGEQGIADMGDIIVIDWRAPIADCYYAPNQLEFTVNQVSYKLALKRKLEIIDGKLVDCVTDFDDESVTLSGTVIDPFLRTVMKDKRRQHRLTDIIQTIQDNQNKIIRKPSGESFIVQGCAGSGKTMILLHRLSYLKFNNPSMSFAGTKIITPNRLFGEHIRGLSEKLGLDQIERLSTEEYYAQLMQKFSRGALPDSETVSETGLKEDLLRELYSSDYQDQLAKHFHEHWEAVLKELDEAKLEQWFAAAGLAWPDCSVHDQETYSTLRNGAVRLLKRIMTYDPGQPQAEEGPVWWTEETRNDLEKSLVILKKLQFNEVQRLVLLTDLHEAYKAHHEKFTRKNYRHKLYLKLLLHSLYYPRFAGVDSFLNIDEAQDLAVGEYRLLRQILGPKCVFNLYGDTNQSVYRYKGIRDWAEVEELISDQVYSLNENYRNTLEVTEFCNEQFSTGTHPVGITGEPVEIKSMEEAVQQLLEQKAEDPEDRMAVILQSADCPVREKLEELLAGQEVSWFSVDDQKISVLSVEMAKGLEFDAVAAVTDGMSDNEKYVAFTRSLDRLIVVNDPFQEESCKKQQ